jgi:uncharacterized protein (DUF1330 family)
MPAYFIAAVQVHDQSRYDVYRRAVMPSIERFGGRFVVLTRRVTLAEGPWQPDRMVVLEFADMPTARAWYDSPEYRAVIEDRQAATTTWGIFADGLPVTPR